MIIYRHTPDMGEISGFGGGYEKTCQDMLEAGAKLLLEDDPELDPQFMGFKGVMGLITEENTDAEKLTSVITSAGGDDITGAMHQAVVTRLLYIKHNGWEAYCSELRTAQQEKGNA